MGECTESSRRVTEESEKKLSQSSSYIPISASSEVLSGSERTSVSTGPMTQSGTVRDTTFSGVMRGGQSASYTMVAVNVHYFCMWRKSVRDGVQRSKRTDVSARLESLVPEYYRYIVFVACGCCVSDKRLDMDDIGVRSDWVHVVQRVLHTRYIAAIWISYLTSGVNPGTSEVKGIAKHQGKEGLPLKYLIHLVQRTYFHSLRQSMTMK